MSSTGTIGGTLDTEALAKLHRPTDLNGMDAAIAELHKQGLTARDIATALDLSIAAVMVALTRRL